MVTIQNTAKPSTAPATARIAKLRNVSHRFIFASHPIRPGACSVTLSCDGIHVGYTRLGQLIFRDRTKKQRAGRPRGRPPSSRRADSSALLDAVVLVAAAAIVLADRKSV